MSELFGRSYVLEVRMQGVKGFKIDSSIKPSLDIDFTVTRTITRDPNTANITVYNLAGKNRSNVETLKNSQVYLYAGYHDKNGLIFKGDTESNNYYDHESLNWKTIFEADDGGKAIRLDRVNLSFAPGTSLMTVINETAKSMRANIGNTVKTALQGKLFDGGKEFVNGVTVSGNAAKQLSRLTKSAGLEWSIQNDTLQLLEKGKPLPISAVQLDSRTGLVGSPTIGNKGIVTIRSLMNKNIYPGCLIRVNSRNLQGQYKAYKCTYVGQTLGNNWYVDIEGKAV